jgi:SAM-dependent methyltransferase
MPWNCLIDGFSHKATWKGYWSMTTTACRVCGKQFFPTPLLQYKNMPNSAQFLPKEESLETDRGVDLDICQCSGCGLVQLSNEPVSYYKEVIRAAGISKEMTNFRKDQFSKFVEDYSMRQKKIVEIGCGKGEYLSIMKETRVDAYGLEDSEESVNFCKHIGLKVSRGFIENSKQTIRGAPFDAFFMLNFLEHLPDPNSTLMGINNNILTGAVGLIEVPNFDTSRKTFFSEFIRDHLFYFTKETLVSTLMFNGFEILDCQKVWHGSILSAIVKKREKIDLSHFSNHRTWLRQEIEKYINKFDAGKVAIWGASHQSLAIISMFNLAQKIRYVIDSAPFKQGKYTPASHIKIVNPDVLDSDPVDAIIVMAALYSNEVAGIIRKKYGTKINVTILKDSGLEDSM